MPTLSICIPTRNRAAHLANCINSLICAQAHSANSFQICISDNNSSDNTASIVQQAPTRLNIKYNKHSANVGFARNLLKVVSMADGEYVWVIGDDDLLMPYAVSTLNRLMDQHPLVDFFYVNSYGLNTDYLARCPHPFDATNFPENMQLLSGWRAEGELPFLDLINPDISFDFLGAYFYQYFENETGINMPTFLTIKLYWTTEFNLTLTILFRKLRYMRMRPVHRPPILIPHR